jgi:hypothetical protein
MYPFPSCVHPSTPPLSSAPSFPINPHHPACCNSDIFPYQATSVYLL